MSAQEQRTPRTPRAIHHLTVACRDYLERAVRDFDARGIPHTDIQDLGSALGLYVLVAWEANDVQLELTAPYPPGQ
jgi:hypothetical protein